MSAMRTSMKLSCKQIPGQPRSQWRNFANSDQRSATFNIHTHRIMGCASSLQRPLKTPPIRPLPEDLQDSILHLEASDTTSKTITVVDGSLSLPIESSLEKPVQPLLEKNENSELQVRACVNSCLWKYSLLSQGLWLHRRGWSWISCVNDLHCSTFLIKAAVVLQTELYHHHLVLILMYMASSKGTIML